MSERGLILWDFDGTLGYNEGKWSANIVEIALREFPACGLTIETVRPLMTRGFPWNEHEQPHVGWTAQEWWQRIGGMITGNLVSLGLTGEQAGRCAELFRQRYLDLSRWRLFDDALPALRGCAERGWRLAILSNHVPELRSILDHLGVSELVEAVFNSAETGYEKPHARAYAIALQALGQPAKAWMIGDNVVADVLGARQAGLRAILVRGSDARAEHCCQSLLDVAKIVDTDGR